MTGYIVRRLLTSIIVLFMVTLLVFGALHIIPGDPTTLMLGMEATEEARQALRHQLGLDLPVHIQYLTWLGKVLRGDLGQSLALKDDISKLLLQRLPTTIPLAVLTMLIAVVIALPAGVLSALKRSSKTDWLISVFAFAGLSFPNFWVGVLLILVFSLYLRVLPPGGYVSIMDDPAEGIRRLLMPAVALGAALAASLTRMTRSSMLEVMGQDYIKTARAKGLAERTVIVAHALRNALIPTVTVLGLQIGQLLGGALIIEEIFSLPGVGRLTIHAVYDRDFPLVQGAVLFIAMVFTMVNLLVDILYVYLDPRIHYD
jgi:peptide/nickel transport system permease protein